MRSPRARIFDGNCEPDTASGAGWTDYRRDFAPGRGRSPGATRPASRTGTCCACGDHPARPQQLPVNGPPSSVSARRVRVADRGPPRATDREPLREAGATRRAMPPPSEGTPLPSGRAPAASVPPLARKAPPPGLSTRAHASSGAHTSRAIGTGHHGRPGHQAAITIHQAQLKDHLDNKIAEHNESSLLLLSSDCPGLFRSWAFGGRLGSRRGLPRGRVWPPLRRTSRSFVLASLGPHDRERICWRGHRHRLHVAL